MIPILYGSQTGHAQDIAWYVAKTLRAEGHEEVAVGSIDAYGTEGLQKGGLVVFVVSTTGQGDHPDNMKQVWDTLRKKGMTSLKGLRYAVLGLGDSSYEKYNYVGKMLHNRLQQLNGTPVVQKGMCDDQDIDGLDTGLRKWLDELLPALSEVAGVPDKEFVPRMKFSTEIVQKAEESPPASPSAVVTANTRLTDAAHWQNVRHIQLSISQEMAACLRPGASLGFVPTNPPAQVTALLKRLSLTGDEVIRIRLSTDTGIALIGTPPAYTTRLISVKTLFTEYLDICGTPGRVFFEVMQSVCPEGPEQNKLKEMASTEGAEDLRFYCTRERRTFIEVLKDFSSIKATVELLLETVPQIQTRQYSISSMPNSTVSVTVAVVEYKTPYGRHKNGLCSSYLERLKEGDKVPVTVHEPTLTFPDEDVPMVLIGPGTGIAPCRSIIQNKEILGWPSDVLCVFGCRNHDKDYLYGVEMEDLAEKTKKFAYHAAFSRDQDRKVYVQDVIRANEEISVFITKTLLQEGGVVYISGNAKAMPQSVEKALTFCLMKHCNAPEEEAEATIKDLKKAKQIQFDTWN